MNKIIDKIMLGKPSFKKNNYGKFHNWSDSPPPVLAKIMEKNDDSPQNQKNDVFFMDIRPLFEHFGDFLTAKVAVQQAIRLMC